MQLLSMGVNLLNRNLMNFSVWYGPGTVRNSVRLRLGMPVPRVIDHTNLRHVLLPMVA
jgi:hypothetical protein